MPRRTKGGQPGNQNAVTHGRYSRETRARRLAELRERNAASAAWMAKIPKWDWEAQAEQLRRLKRERDNG